MPVRLRGNFMDRPWPQQPDFGERIVDTYHVPPAMPESPHNGSVLEIVGDTAIKLDGRSRNFRPEARSLQLLNILLLTRGFFVRHDDFVALAGLEVTEKISAHGHFKRACQAFLTKDEIPKFLAKRYKLEGPGSQMQAVQLHLGVVVIDRRAERTAG